jgi:hypothetical protein
MEEFLKLYGSGDNAAMAFGIFLVFLGIFAPKKFFGIEFEWTPATSAVALVAGVTFFAFSYPKLRFWTDTVNVDRAVIATLAANTQKAIDGINSARSGNSYPWCFDKASTGLAPLNDNLASLNKLSATK